jgi:hypothetical protein
VGYHTVGYHTAGYNTSKTRAYRKPTTFHSLHHFNPKLLKLCPSTQLQNHLIYIIFSIKKVPVSSDSLQKTQSVQFSDTLLLRPHVILTQLLIELLFLTCALMLIAVELMNIFPHICPLGSKY